MVDTSDKGDGNHWKESFYKGVSRMKINGTSMENRYIHSNMPESKGQPKKSDNQKTEGIRDEYVPSSHQQKPINYDKPKIDQGTIQKLKAESERTYQHLRQMVEKLLKQQGLTLKDADKLEIDEETRLEAQGMIAEGGPLSPEAVSDRIVDFAKAISGGDKEKIGMLRDAIEEGFRAVEKIFGGELPEISKRTYQLVMEKLDKWAEE